MTYNSTAVSQTDIGEGAVHGVAAGKYYVLDNVAPSGANGAATVNLTYTPKEYASGEFTVKAFVPEQERGATNTETGTVSQKFTVDPENSGYNINLVAPQGNEDAKIQLKLSGSKLNDTDGSEKAISATLSNVPDDYLVFVGTNATTAKVAANVGDKTWAITLNSDGSLPDYIAIQPKENASGVVKDISLNVLSGETDLAPTMTTKTFDLTVNPVADGIKISPAQVIRDANASDNKIKLNLNATMNDTDGSETATVELTGIGKSDLIFCDRSSALTQTYDSNSDTYKLEGIKWDEVPHINFSSNEAFNKTVSVKAWTVDTAEGLSPVDSSGSVVTDSFRLNVAEYTPPAPAPVAPISGFGSAAPVGEAAEDLDGAIAPTPLGNSMMDPSLLVDEEEVPLESVSLDGGEGASSVLGLSPAGSSVESDVSESPTANTIVQESAQESESSAVASVYPLSESESIDLSALGSGAPTTGQLPGAEAEVVSGIGSLNSSDLLDSPSDTLPLSNTSDVASVPSTPESSEPIFVPTSAEVARVEQEMAESAAAVGV